MQKIILASSSPRRKELLSLAGISFEISVPNIDEAIVSGESPQEMVSRLALAKAEVVSSAYPDNSVFAADTTVALGDEIYGKPEDREDAFRILNDLQGKQHSVWGGYALINQATKHKVVWTKETKVELAKLSTSEINEYIDTREPLDKAGAYGAQGIGMKYVIRVIGSYSNVIGLDLPSFLENFKRINDCK